MPDFDSSLLPRKPTRSNGVQKYSRLVDAAAKIVQERGVEALSIQNVADVAQVPKASVYHFFPTPDAIAVALAENLFENFGLAVARAEQNLTADASPRDFIVGVLRETAAYYEGSPLARILFLGSSYSWAIRLTDVRQSVDLAGGIAATLAKLGLAAPKSVVVDAAIVSVALADAVWSLSVTESGDITSARQTEAERAVCSYLQAVGVLTAQDSA